MPVASLEKVRGKGSVVIMLMRCRTNSSINVTDCLSGKSFSPFTSLSFKQFIFFFLGFLVIRNLIIASDLSSRKTSSWELKRDSPNLAFQRVKHHSDGQCH